jgi:hypothetical protein
VLVYALAAKVLKRVKFSTREHRSRFPQNFKTAAPETQRVMFFKKQEKEIYQPAGRYSERLN